MLTLTLSLHLSAMSNPWPFYNSLSCCLKNSMNLRGRWSYWWMLAGNWATQQWYNDKRNFIVSLYIIYRWLLDRWTMCLQIYIHVVCSLMEKPWKWSFLYSPFSMMTICIIYFFLQYILIIIFSSPTPPIISSSPYTSNFMLFLKIKPKSVEIKKLNKTKNIKQN